MSNAPCRNRDPARRALYLTDPLRDLPRLLGAIDRNPYRATYGCLDRSFWHYRTSSFPSEMFQEGALPLAVAYVNPLPGNRWHADPRVRELALAAVCFAARSSHPDGSCDDYYPFERALGAAVFSLHAAARTCQLLSIDDADVQAWLERRADWIMRHDESGVLANHHALAALGLWSVGEVTGRRAYYDAARHFVARVLRWQDAEGWFEEYDGCDPGYQTLTIDCLAKLRRLSGDAALDEPLRRAVELAHWFLHPDSSYAGQYGSRGTYHFFPHGMELLAAVSPEAAALADGHLEALAAGRQAHFDDDRMFAHRTANLMEAYLDWSPHCPATLAETRPPLRFFPSAGILVRRTPRAHSIASAARGGVIKHFGRSARSTGDAGLIVQTTDGRIAVSQLHDRRRPTTFSQKNAEEAVLTVEARLDWVRFETATPARQALFHLGMITVGRWCRTLVRKLLQRRLITGRRPCPMRLVRCIELLSGGPDQPGTSLRIVDRIELLDNRLRVRRMSFGSDHQTAYVAACGVYQDSVLTPWTDLSVYVERLNKERCVEIRREFP